MPAWLNSHIQHGDQTGRKYVYPTINLNPTVLPELTQRGVYASLVKLADKQYKGALYFGPRKVKQETHDVLEIYLLDFEGEVSEKSVSFVLVKFVRGVMDFQNLEELREQVGKDIMEVGKALDEK